MFQGAVVRDTDMGLADAVKEIESLNNAYVKVGFQVGDVTRFQTKKGRSKHAGLSLPQIAAENEYGVPRKNVPARPFMSTSFDENIDLINRRIQGQFNRITSGRSTVRNSLEILGQLMTDLIQRKIRAIRYPANAPSTIALKGSSKPLIDFGQMVQSVRYEVVIS